jgi:hypothetical protein
MKYELVPLDTVLEALRARLKRRTQQALAKRWGVSTSLISQSLKGRDIGPAICERLGFERIAFRLYRRTR